MASSSLIAVLLMLAALLAIPRDDGRNECALAAAMPSNAVGEIAGCCVVMDLLSKLGVAEAAAGARESGGQASGGGTCGGHHGTLRYLDV